MAMNPLALKAARIAFGPEGVKRLQAGLCPSCGSDNKDFRDAASRLEHGRNGMCQKCQDRIFGPMNDLDDDLDDDLDGNDDLIGGNFHD